MSVTPLPPPVILKVAPLPAPLPICRVPELLSALTLTSSFVPYKIICAPAALVKVPLTLTVFVPPEKPLAKRPELFTLPVTESVVVVAPLRDSSSTPPLAMVKAPPLGVTVVVCPLFRYKVPATVVKFANPFVDTPPLITFNFPLSSISDPATMSVTPSPPPVILKVAPLPAVLPISRVPERVNIHHVAAPPNLQNGARIVGKRTSCGDGVAAA